MHLLTYSLNPTSASHAATGVFAFLYHWGRRFFGCPAAQFAGLFGTDVPFLGLFFPFPLRRCLKGSLTVKAVLIAVSYSCRENIIT